MTFKTGGSAKDTMLTGDKKLYKYYAFSKWTKAIVTEGEVYFSSPRAFNDPFDCRLNFRNLRGMKKDMKKIYKDRLAGLSGREKRAEAAKFGRKIKPDSPLVEGILDGLQNSLYSLGVFCLSEEFDNILMWSHYAQDHTGFCVEFSAGLNVPILQRAQRVNYSTEMPDVGWSSSHLEYYTSFILTKAAEWSYEREWRIIEPNGPGVQRLPAGAVTALVMGCRISPEHQSDILEWVRSCRDKPRVLQARAAKGSYRLDIEEFNLGTS